MPSLLSPNFKLEEFTRSSTHPDIPNKPDYIQIVAMKHLCLNVLEPLREKFGPIHIISGFRSPALNFAVGSKSSTSQHMNGEAADIEIAGVRNDTIWEYINQSLPFDQVIAEKLKSDDGTAGWIHVSYAEALRGDAISFLGNGQYVKGLHYA